VRGIARQKLGYFPLSQNEAERIRRFLSFREDCDATSVLDPCAGGGAAMATITSTAVLAMIRFPATTGTTPSSAKRGMTASWEAMATTP